MQIKNNGFTIIELILVIMTIGILVAIIIPGSNFSYIASAIISESQIASEPVKKEIEKYYLENKQFPDKSSILDSFKSINKPKRVKKIEPLSKGRIRIIYDTSDIKWGATWWHNWDNPLSNDLTGKDLILVPVIDGDKLTWDECSFGTVPKRNRHYKCSQHK